MTFRYIADYPLERATEGSAGFDLPASEEAWVKPGQIVMVGTGVRVEIPKGHVGLVFIRSSVGKHGVTLSNSVGVIDSDYRGEIKLSLVNNGPTTHHIYAGSYIAQLVVVPFVGEAVQADTLDTTARGEGGFGSTGE